MLMVAKNEKLPISGSRYIKDKDPACPWPRRTPFPRLAHPDDSVLGMDGSIMDFRTPRVWTALVAKPSQEQKAADWLKEARLSAYWPCYPKQINAGRGSLNGFAQRKRRFMPVIPGYLFMAIRTGSNVDPWEIVRQTPGIVSYLRDGDGKPATLSDDDIEIIRRIEGGLNLPADPTSAHHFKVGDKVRFVDDILGRWPPGAITRLADDGRISVDVKLLGRVVPILAHPHQIEAM